MLEQMIDLHDFYSKFLRFSPTCFLWILNFVKSFADLRCSNIVFPLSFSSLIYNLSYDKLVEIFGVFLTFDGENDWVVWYLCDAVVSVDFWNRLALQLGDNSKPICCVHKKRKKISSLKMWLANNYKKTFFDRETILTCFLTAWGPFEKRKKTAASCFSIGFKL